MRSGARDAGSARGDAGVCEKTLLCASPCPAGNTVCMPSTWDTMADAPSPSSDPFSGARSRTGKDRVFVSQGGVREAEGWPGPGSYPRGRQAAGQPGSRAAGQPGSRAASQPAR